MQYVDFRRIDHGCAPPAIGWCRLAVMPLVLAALAGCSRGDTTVPANDPAAPVAEPAAASPTSDAPTAESLTAAPEPPSLNRPAALLPSSDLVELPAPRGEPDPDDDAAGSDETAVAATRGERSVLSSDFVEPSDPTSDSADGTAIPVDAVAGGALQLPADLTPSQLAEFLGQADRELNRIAHTAVDPAAATQELKRVAGLKLQAAERLLAQPELPPGLARAGRQGKLQALSHLAAMGDIAAANQLRPFAAELAAATNDPRLHADSQMVLIGFALQDLRAGQLKDPATIVDLVTQLAASTEWLDMAALMAMGQARGVLQQYGYDQQANLIRQQIVDAFAAHPDPAVASTAMQLAGSDRFDQLQALRHELGSGGDVTAEQWRQAAADLFGGSPDASSVQYLASAGLQFEADERPAFAEATYQVLESQLDAVPASVAEEMRRVLEAHAARRSAIGQSVEVDLPDLQGAAIDWSSYRGRIVLMPFWAAGYPLSLEILPVLERIQAQHRDAVAIVGVNVDFPDVPLGQFVQQHAMQWPTLRSPDPARQGMMNPLAQQLGLASMPFVAVIDADGRVAHISLDGRGIEDAVARLLPSSERPAP